MVDPTPDQIRERAAEIRRQREAGPRPGPVSGRPRPWERERVRTPGTERAPRVYRTPVGFRGIGDSD